MLRHDIQHQTRLINAAHPTVLAHVYQLASAEPSRAALVARLGVLAGLVAHTQQASQTAASC